MEGILTIGEKFASWGVELDRGDGPGGVGDGGLFIPTDGDADSAPDAATAQAFITEQVAIESGLA